MMHHPGTCWGEFMEFVKIRADSRFAPSQWETVLLYNDVSHWLGTNLESALKMSGIVYFYTIGAHALASVNPLIAESLCQKNGTSESEMYIYEWKKNV